MNQVPYAGTLGEREPQQVIAETPARLSRVLDALTPQQVETPPAPGKWNVREVVAHLADCEIAWSWRLRQALAEENATLQPFDQDAWSRPYAAYSLAAARGTFLALRAWNIAFIGALSAADKGKRYTHPSRGEETLWTIVQIMGGHDTHHLEKLEALLTER
jgi:uncharacterized damage-inducible protein DinB